MKLAVMTWYHYRNYGTALQVSALCRVLRELGHEPTVIQYKPNWYFPQIPDYRLSSVLKRYLRRAPAGSRPRPKEYCPEEKEARFAAYQGETLRFTAPCVTKTDLERLNEDYDAFLCGSDQIWSPLCYNARYFLDFVHDPRKKIAYAPSLGVKTWDDLYVKRAVGELLRDFDSISVREEQGRKLIRECSGRDAAVVLDPTLLLRAKDWEAQLPQDFPRPEKPYLLVYQLGSDPAQLELAAQTAAELGLELRLIPVSRDDLDKPGCIPMPIGPREFLAWIRNASYVCTDSFHGMTISVLFHRPFTALPRFQARDPRNQNSRVLQLLRTVSMEDRLFDGKNGARIPQAAPDFERADAALEAQRASSLQYLTEALRHADAARPLPRRVTVQNSLCCGCGACAQVCPTGAIQIGLNGNGFLSARVEERKCVSCGKCLKVCPYCGETRCASAKEAALFSFQSGSPEVLLRSSSGGAAFALARKLLARGYTLAGCRYDRQTQRAEHILVRSREELSQLQGSKYIQSAFSNALGELAACPGPVAVFGTPCQIAAARRILGDRPEAVFIDLVCHGIPTDHLFRRWLRYVQEQAQVDPAKAELSFRCKDRSWRDIYLRAADGTHEYCRNQKQDPFFRMFEYGVCYGEACYECRWRGDSEADIRLGDYWGPRFADDQAGVSMVLCFTPKGKALAEALADAGHLERQPVEDYLDHQAQSNPFRPVFYPAVLRDIRNQAADLETMADKYTLQLEDRTLSQREQLRHTLRMIVYDHRFLEK